MKKQPLYSEILGMEDVELPSEGWLQRIPCIISMSNVVSIGSYGREQDNSSANDFTSRRELQWVWLKRGRAGDPPPTQHT